MHVIPIDDGKFGGAGVAAYPLRRCTGCIQGKREMVVNRFTSSSVVSAATLSTSCALGMRDRSIRSNNTLKAN